MKAQLTQVQQKILEVEAVREQQQVTRDKERFLQLLNDLSDDSDPEDALTASADSSESEEDSDYDPFEDPRLALTQMNEALEPNVRERVYEKEKENENEMRHDLKHQNRPRGRARGSLGSVFSNKNKLDDRIKNVDDETHQRKRLHTTSCTLLRPTQSG